MKPHVDVIRKALTVQFLQRVRHTKIIAEAGLGVNEEEGTVSLQGRLLLEL